MGEMSEFDGFVIAAGYAGVLWFVCIADSQQGVKESVVTVTCSSVWCWGVWESWNSYTGHLSSGSQGDFLFSSKVLPDLSFLSVLPIF